MEKLTRIMLCVSAVFALIMAGLSIYAAQADSKWYMISLLCLFVAVWFGYSFFRSSKDRDNQDKH
jgi:threonine/homoserine/homoserine lactone efflux protein